ncbi:MAG: hypothetical protein Q9227_006948 [Pyrenula ochraceoflavens]
MSSGHKEDLETQRPWVLKGTSSHANKIPHRTIPSSVYLVLTPSGLLVGGPDPLSPYTFDPPSLSTFWGIDGTLLTIKDQLYFVWSCHTNASPNQVQSLCISATTGTSLTGPTSVISTPTLPWETHGFPVNEGPQALYNTTSGKTWLTYSASHCSTPHYSLGLLTYIGNDHQAHPNANPLDPSSWRKSKDPVFKSDGPHLFGTGHNG